VRRGLAAGRPFWFTLIVAPALLVGEFVFFLISPRLLLELPFKWRDLVPGAAVCTVAAIVVHAVTVFFLRNWVAAYGNSRSAILSAVRCVCRWGSSRSSAGVSGGVRAGSGAALGAGRCGSP
jgi:hypothetical protein